AMSRMGIPFGPKGATPEAIVGGIHAFGKKFGWQVARAVSAPIAGDALFNIARKDDWAAVVANMKGTEPANLDDLLKSAIPKQEQLGTLAAKNAGLMERTYAATGDVFSTMAVGISQLVTLVSQIFDFIRAPKEAAKKVEHAVTAYFSATQPAQALANAAPGTLAELGFGAGRSISSTVRGWVSGSSAGSKAREAFAVRQLMAGGMSQATAAAFVGNFMQESGLDPLATPDNGAHRGIAQWDRTRQAAFAKWAGYQMGSLSVSRAQQLADQLNFVPIELATTQKKAWADIASAFGLFNKSAAVMADYEKPGDGSLWKRFGFADEALRGIVSMVAATASGPVTTNHSISNSVHISGGIHAHTPSPDPKAHAAAMGKELSRNPLLSPLAQQQVVLLSRGTAG
ncbi:MAG: phage tail tip lysozyme, partial [Terracidiphilus sp.]